MLVGRCDKDETVGTRAAHKRRAAHSGGNRVGSHRRVDGRAGGCCCPGSRGSRLPGWCLVAGQAVSTDHPSTACACCLCPWSLAADVPAAHLGFALDFGCVIGVARGYLEVKQELAVAVVALVRLDADLKVHRLLLALWEVDVDVAGQRQLSQVWGCESRTDTTGRESVQSFIGRRGGRPRQGRRAAAGLCMAPLLCGAVQRPHLCSTAALQLTALAFQRLLLLHPSFACPACSRHRDTGGLQCCGICSAVAWWCMDSAGRAAPLITLTLNSLIILPRVVARHGCPRAR